MKAYHKSAPEGQAPPWRVSHVRSATARSSSLFTRRRSYLVADGGARLIAGERASFTAYETSARGSDARRRAEAQMGRAA